MSTLFLSNCISLSLYRIQRQQIRYGAHTGSSCEGICFSENNRRVLRSVGGNEILTLDMGDAGVTNRVEVKDKRLTSICSSGERDEVVLVGTEKGEVLTIDLRMGGVVQSQMSVSSSPSSVRWIAKRRRRGSGKGSRGRTKTAAATTTTTTTTRVKEEKKKRVVLKESVSEPQKTQEENILKQKQEEMKRKKEEEERKRKIEIELKRREEKENELRKADVVSSSSSSSSLPKSTGNKTSVMNTDEQQQQPSVSWSVEYLQDKIDERMEMMEDRHHDDVRELSLEMVRQLQIQENKIAQQFENMKLWMKNLMDENRKLREELETLKHVH